MPAPTPLDEAINALQGIEGGPTGVDFQAPTQHSKEYIYWKLCTFENCSQHSQRGWVVIGPALQPRTAMEYSEFQQVKHATPLPQYGRNAAGKMVDGATRLIPLIEAGGIHEIPIEQAVAYQWHRKPALVKLLPELEGIPTYPCNHGCDTRGPRARVFNTTSGLEKHIKVMHKDVAQPAAIGREIGKVIEAMRPDQQSGTLGINLADATQMAALVKAIVVAIREDEKENKVSD